MLTAAQIATLTIFESKKATYIKFQNSLEALGYTKEHANHLIRKKVPLSTLNLILEYHHQLQINYSHEQIVKIAAQNGGYHNLKAVIQTQATLTAIGFNTEQIAKIAANSGGSKNLYAVIEAHAVLTALHFNTEQIVKIAAHGGGSKNLDAVIKGQAALVTLGFNAEQIIKIVSHFGGSKNLNAVIQGQSALTILGFNAEQIVKLAAHGGGSKNLNAVIQGQVALTTLGFSHEQIIKITSHDGGSKNLNAVIQGQTVLSLLGLNAEQIVKIAAHRGGSKNLEALIRNSATILRLGLSSTRICKFISRGKAGREQLENEIRLRSQDIQSDLFWLEDFRFTMIDTLELSDPILADISDHNFPDNLYSYVNTRSSPSIIHGFFDAEKKLFASSAGANKRDSGEISSFLSDISTIEEELDNQNGKKQRFC